MKFVITKEESWDGFNWFWRVPGESESLENPTGRHGGYPFRWVAWLSGFLHTIGRS